MGQCVPNNLTTKMRRTLACSLLLLLALPTRAADLHQGNFLTCTVCEAVMTAVDDMILDPTNEQAIADFLGQVCRYLGGQLETYCIEFLAEYTDDIIDQLVNEFLKPEEVCAAIAACP